MTEAHMSNIWWFLSFIKFYAFVLYNKNLKKKHFNGNKFISLFGARSPITMKVFIGKTCQLNTFCMVVVYFMWFWWENGW